MTLKVESEMQKLQEFSIFSLLVWHKPRRCPPQILAVFASSFSRRPNLRFRQPLPPSSPPFQLPRRRADVMWGSIKMHQAIENHRRNLIGGREGGAHGSVPFRDVITSSGTYISDYSTYQQTRTLVSSLKIATHCVTQSEKARFQRFLIIVVSIARSSCKLSGSGSQLFFVTTRGYWYRIRWLSCLVLVSSLKHLCLGLKINSVHQI